MHEHLRNLRPSWVAFGWFVAVGITAMALVALSALDLVRQETPVETLWVTLSVVAGFVLSGFYVGTRVNAAPVLNGVAMALFSLVAWGGLNLFLGEPTGVTAWDALHPRSAVTLLAVQTAASVIGTRAGVRWARRR